MTIEDKNKLIAEFCNAKQLYQVIDPSDYHGICTLETNNTKEEAEHNKSHYDERYDIETEIIPMEFNYNKDWNWLMTVVEKIENLKIKNHTQFDVIICKNSVEILGFYKGNECVKFRTGLYNRLTKIGSLYEMIVEFIIWYNKNKDDEN